VDGEYLNELKNEVELIRTIDHPNVVKALEVYYSHKQIYVVMEFCSGGDLYSRQPYSEQQSAKITTKLLSALAYLHKRNISHRDLKFENIMFESNAENAEIKLIDFGLSKKYAPEDTIMYDVCGTIYTMAPEVLRGLYTSKADLWSVGVIVYMLLSGTKPFYQRTRQELVHHIRRGEYTFDPIDFEHVSDDAKEFVSSLIVVNPLVRLSSREALQHYWLRDTYRLSSDRRRSNKEKILLLEAVKENMKEYCHAPDLKKIALGVVAHKSNTESIIGLRKVFNEYDVTNDGTISKEKFSDGMKKFGCTNEEIDSMFASVDVKHDGTIYYSEFLAATLETRGRIETDYLMAAFDHLDGNNTGRISKTDLRRVLGKDYSDKRANELIAAVDVSGDGTVSYEEFLTMFQTKVVKQQGTDVVGIVKDKKRRLSTLADIKEEILEQDYLEKDDNSP